MGLFGLTAKRKGLSQRSDVFETPSPISRKPAYAKKRPILATPSSWHSESAARPPPEAPLYARFASNKSQSLPVPCVDEALSPAASSVGSWDDLADAAVNASASASRPTSPLETNSKPRVFSDIRPSASSTLSLPLAQSAGPQAQAQRRPAATATDSGKSSRWTFGRKAKQRSGSIASMSMFDFGSPTREKETGFVVKSFRQVSNVRADSETTISTGPYEMLPAQVAVPKLVLRTTAAPAPFASHRPSLTSLEPLDSPVLGTRAQGSSRPSSPSISVEQFRLASQRNRSNASLLSLDSQHGGGSAQRPRFEPTRRTSSTDSTNARFDFARARTVSGGLAASQSSSVLRSSHGTSSSVHDGDDGYFGSRSASTTIAEPSSLEQHGDSFAEPSSLEQHGDDPLARDCTSVTPSSPLRVSRGAEVPWHPAVATASSPPRSDDEESDEDDIPLAALAKNRSQESLTLTPAALRPPPLVSSVLPHSPSVSSLASFSRPLSSEFEVLQEDQSSTIAERSVHSTSRSVGLIRRVSRGIQQRSLSALSFSSSRSTINAPIAPSLGPRIHSEPSEITTLSTHNKAQLARDPLRSSEPGLGSVYSTSSIDSDSGSSLPFTPRTGSSPATSVSEISPARAGRLQPGTYKEGTSRGSGGLGLTLTAPSPMRYHQRTGSSSSSSHRPPTSSVPPRSASSLGFSSARPALRAPQPSNDVFERMKVRHRREASLADSIGRDLNSPDGRVPDRDEDEDDEAPLAELSQRSRTSSAGAAYFNHQMHFMSPASPASYSLLATAPPGVDPYLYASLPVDQRMSLHQRAQQMMTLMGRAAEQAKAESVGSWSGASAPSQTAFRPTHTPFSMSVDQLGAMWLPPPQFAGSTVTLPRLPAFAPPVSASQQFFAQQAYPSMGGPAAGASVKTDRAGRKAPASTIGMSR